MATRQLACLLAAASAVSLAAPYISAAETSSLRTAPAVGIYYSFEKTPFPITLASMHAEMERILGPAGLPVAWRPLEDDRRNENFTEVFVFRFRGSCDLQTGFTWAESSDQAIHELADTQRSDGLVLPFGKVQCDQLRRYLAPAMVRIDEEERQALIGRALARVVAHELFHMLTRSAQHSKQGIARASHSRQDLLTEHFDFAKADSTWLRDWRNRSIPALESLVSAEGPAAQSAVAGDGLR